MEEKLKAWARGELKPEPKVKWLSEKPRTCDGCNRPLTGTWFVDGKTIYGPWGIMGACCFKAIGTGLGTGRGQKYDLRTLEKLEG